MRYDDLLKPVSADAPCGEDLLAADDDAFIDYYFSVEDRLPTSYFNLLRGTLFDPRSVDHKAETTRIDALLKHTRDLRLLVLEAKFQILAGRFKGFADAILAMAGLLEAYPDDVHPRAVTDPTDRRNALEELTAAPTVIAPLEYAVLMTDKRYGDVTLRPYLTGTGKVAPRADETPGDSSGILAALGNSENAKVVDALHELVGSVQTALTRITDVCKAGPVPHYPSLVRLSEKIGDVQAMILVARSDLGAPEAPGPEITAEGGEAVDAAGATITYAMPATPADVPDHKAAHRLLSAVERYFAACEPASLALVLVTQSRLLIGRPLVEALDVLVEDTANRAVIDFGSETGFSISMARMRVLSETAGIPAAEAWDDDPEPAPDILSREHAGQILKSIEDFFRMREPASPIPILLFKARNLLSKDFHALVRELLPPDTYR